MLGIAHASMALYSLNRNSPYVYVVFPFCGSIELLATEYEAATEVFLAYNGIVGQLLRCALEENFALKQQISAVGDAQRLGGIVVGDEDAYVLFLELIYDILYILDSDGVDTGKRLVEHDKLGVDGEATCYLGATAFTTR